ncbi:MAG: sulfotransferase domain-containing protein [Rhodobacteraceae bacterium]|nr:sulfotransferase domain-containing protein [Paracoccaceae bacterium]
MKLRSIRDNQKRASFLADIAKKVKAPFRGGKKSSPRFIFGRQRSGTSMLMFALHLHPETLVFDEHRNSRAFHNYLLRDLEIINDLVNKSKYDFVCFKPICDSHKAIEIMSYFLDAKALWVFRNFRDSALSALKKFKNPTRAIRIVCRGEPGGGWFQDGVSEDMAAKLRLVYREDMSDFDLACLVWWARNQIYIEQQLFLDPRISLANYETLAAAPENELRWVFNRLEIPFDKRCSKLIRPTEIRKMMPYSSLSEEVESLCEETWERLMSHYLEQRAGKDIHT